MAASVPRLTVHDRGGRSSHLTTRVWPLPLARPEAYLAAARGGARARTDGARDGSRRPRQGGAQVNLKLSC